MANSIEYAATAPTMFVTPTSRYASSRVLKYSDQKITTFETYKRKSFVMASGDQLAVIPNSMEYRPDLMSIQRYGTTDFWWRIMEVNNIKDIMDFKAGKTIVLPENIYG
jgi:hypothetical protein